MWFRNQLVPVCIINATGTENPSSETRMEKGNTYEGTSLSVVNWDQANGTQNELTLSEACRPARNMGWYVHFL
jgi:hypothetical protein